jgi:signal transduction histidine kinase/ActR/RegA family two-component response regulator
MRLAEFIFANIEPILAEWEVFAREIWPVTPEVAEIDPSRLRDDAEEILRATIRDMASPQTAEQQSAKSKGEGHTGATSIAVNRASSVHGSGRVSEGFDLWAVVAEYRALRASVLRLWSESEPTPDAHDLVDLTRFNESIDQSLTEAVRSYAAQVKRDREALLGNEQSARHEAESANRAKDIFLATLSHEMRTPLNAIVGWINILRAEGRTEERIAEGLDVIERNTRAQVQLIEDVLDVSGIVSGKMRLEMCNCDLRERINAGIDAVRPAAMARDISIDVRLDPEASQTSCDPTRFQQIVWNLVSNAIKFTPKGGSVRVTLERERSTLKFAVRDNGQGISPDELPHIFDRFRQADSGTRRRFRGLGLGLSIVKYLVEMHGGTVQAHSDGEHHGSTFTVRLPVRAVNVVEADAWPAADQSGLGKTLNDASPALGPVRLDGLRVLVVDDEPDARRMLLELLEGAGANVTVAGSAQEALKALEAGRFDVLLSDLGMPDQDGYDLIREVRRRGHDAKMLQAIALTGFARHDDERDAISAGFQRHIPKPVNVHGLTAIIASLAGRTAWDFPGGSANSGPPDGAGRAVAN